MIYSRKNALIFNLNIFSDREVNLVTTFGYKLIILTTFLNNKQEIKIERKHGCLRKTNFDEINFFILS